jgi:2-isopropylmalate synthase
MKKSIVKRSEPVIFDSTLREGFQTPGGIGASLEERVYAASLIQKYADWVEIGMPANNVDYEIIDAIIDRFNADKRSAGIAVLARCADLDIERSAEVLASYSNSLIHLFVGTSDEHRKIRFGGKDEDFYADLIRNSVQKAAARPEFSRVMFSPEDSYRTFMHNKENLARFVQAAKDGYESGNKKVGRVNPIIFNLPDTVGYSTIEEFNSLIGYVQEKFKDDVEWSIHCHNDNGMSQAHAIDMYQRYGVNWLQTTFAQLGERNGISSTDLMVKMLSERGYLNNPRIVSKENIKELDPTTKAILWALGRQVPDEHLDRTMVSTGGIHTDLVRKDTNTYHIRGSEYGSQVIIELGPTSGSNQVKSLLEKFGVPYDQKRIEQFTDKIKAESNERKSPLDITTILYDAQTYFNGKNPDEGIKVIDYLVSTTKEGLTKLIMVGTIGEKHFNEVYESNGPVEAAMGLLNNVINKIKGANGEIHLESYKPRVIPVLDKKYLIWPAGSNPDMPENVGKDAHLGISLTFRNGSGVYQGWARHENSTIAEVNAVIDGMSKMYALQKWNTPLKAIS